MERPPVGTDELVEHWTVLGDERDLIRVPVVTEKFPTDITLQGRWRPH